MIIFFRFFFFEFFVHFEMIYQKMESKRSCCLGYRCCKIIGLTIGWFGVLLSGILIYGLCEHPARFGKSLHETIIPFLPGELPCLIHVFVR